MLLYKLHPLLNTFQRIAISSIINQDNSDRILHIHLGQREEFLLASGVPQVHLELFALEAGDVLECFGAVVRGGVRHAFFRVRVIYYSVED